MLLDDDTVTLVVLDCNEDLLCVTEPLDDFVFNGVYEPDIDPVDVFDTLILRVCVTVCLFDLLLILEDVLTGVLDELYVLSDDTVSDDIEEYVDVTEFITEELRVCSLVRLTFNDCVNEDDLLIEPVILTEGFRVNDILGDLDRVIIVDDVGLEVDDEESVGLEVNDLLGNLVTDIDTLGFRVFVCRIERD